MDSWVRSFFAGLLLAALAIGALSAFHTFSPYFEPLLREYTGMKDTSLIGVILLTFLVGFSLAHRREPEQLENAAFIRRGMFSAPNKRISPSISQNDVEQIDLVQEAYIAYLQDRIANLDENQPIILKIKLHPPSKVDFHFLGRTLPLQRDVMLYYMENLKRFPNFKFVVFVDWFNRFLFFAKASDFRKEIEPISGTHIIDLLNGNRVKELGDLPLFNANAVTNHASNLKTLKFMARKEIGDIMVVSHTWGRRVIGVVELNKLLGHLLAPKRVKGRHLFPHQETDQRDSDHEKNDLIDDLSPRGSPLDDGEDDIIPPRTLSRPQERQEPTFSDQTYTKDDPETPH